MSFLQPMLLAGLALAALPIIIHLINQRRYQTIRWGAMMFLLAANRMSRGFARIRQWLILLMRVLAVACLAFVIARPLTSGWLGLAAAGRADTTLVLLDRSPSMQQAGSGGGESKLAAGRRQLIETLERLPSSHWVLVESTTNQPRELESPRSLEHLPETEPSGAAADWPAMLQAAHDYIVANQSGRTEIWLLSDLRTNDWSADDARWEALRSAFAAFPQGVRFHLLAYPSTAPANVAVRLTGVRHRTVGDGGELLVSLRLERAEESPKPVSVPIQFEIDGARSVLNAELVGKDFELREHRIPLGPRQQRGWGRVSIPADANPADNEFYFAFDQAETHRTAIVADDPNIGEALRLAASIPTDPGELCSAEVIDLAQAGSIDWDKTALVLWQAPLPQGETAKQLEAFVARGGQAIFFPPLAPEASEFMGASWQAWSAPPEGAAVETWRGDQDLLAHTQSGMSLPVGQLELHKVCGLSGEVTPLASLKGGAPLVARAPTPRGGVYFIATTPAAGASSLASDGIVLYVAVQRALANGAAAIGGAQQLIAGEPGAEAAAQWRRLAGDERGVSIENAFQPGAYAAEEAVVALNRPEAEDAAGVLADDRVAALFRDLDFVRIDEEAGSARSLVQEVWRSFLAAMMFALVAEAWLSMPRVASAARQAGMVGAVGLR
ncbi:MAG TPA: BatA domain-containing protein [Pirellulales bacterium]|nr:BatA domain-containing protein [Pirellulales bacterium]